MVEGESGLLEVCAGDIGNVPEYLPSKRRVQWPNGAAAILFSAEKPTQLRGPQCECWCADELSHWQYLDDTWDNLQFGARLGKHVQGVVTTTPRPSPTLKKIMADPRTIVTRGSMWENKANLSPTAIESLRTRYEGTRLGRQEIHGEILDDNPFALWKRDQIERDRVTEAPKLVRVFVGIDPAVSSNEESAETGIIVVGRDNQKPAHFYVLADLTVSMATPEQWGRAAITAYNLFKADALIPEVNQGGDMVSSTIRTIDPRVPIKPVRATRGKRTRAEPVSALSEQGRLHHVGTFPQMEDQLVEWVPGDDSPDRMDALVWAVTALMDRQGLMMPFDRKRIGV